jgi:hypothetical protein
MEYRPLVIIGAPRSGTNMLRDVLCKFDGVSTWPCDEINYIWRHGNVGHATDEIPPERVTSDVSAYIRKQFDWVARRYDAHTVVEKTCANSLRVPFVDRIIPEARYVFIYRDGLDVVGSAMKRWKAELDIPYLARKARFVPLSDLPFYASRYFWNRIYRVVSREERLAFWGPQFVGLDEALERHTLAEVCALQWQRCVELSEDAFSRMPTGKVSRVSYEAFVRSPDKELQRIANELSLELDDGLLARAVSNVSAGSIGKGRVALNEETTGVIRSLIGDTLTRYGYA